MLQGFVRDRGYPVDDDQGNLFTDEKAFSADPKWLESTLVDRGGLALLRANRFAGHKIIRDAHLGIFLRTIATNAERLPDAVLNDVFDALMPGAGICLRARRIAVFSIYGTTVFLILVELPLPLLNQIRQRTFKGHAVERKANAVYRTAEAALIRLALASPDHLYALGPARPREPWESDLLESPADLLLRSQVDIRPLRNARHQNLRRALNRAKDQYLGRSAKASEAHLAMRRLLDGTRRQYVL